MTQQPRPFVKGLDGVVAVQTELSSIDGQRGVLTYRGINIHELAEQATYEEVCYLLLYSKLPNRAELADFQARLAAQRALPAGLLDLLRTLPRDSALMDALRTAVSALSFYAPGAGDLAVDATQRKAVTLIAQMPTLVAALHRLRDGQEPIAPRADLGHAANALYMLDGREPDADFAHALDLYFIPLADHGMNASTFTARVVA
jgi:citrate synthase